MPTTEMQGIPPETEAALQLALEPVVTELRNALFQKLVKLVPANEPAVESFRLRADALVEALLSDLGKSLSDSVVRGLLVSTDPQVHSRQEALTHVLSAAGAGGQALPTEGESVDLEELLTSEQAAKLLQVSRPHVNKLLDRGIIPGVLRLEGGHRRIARGAVMQYRVVMKQRQAQALDEMVRLSEEMGLYADELEGVPATPKR